MQASQGQTSLFGEFVAARPGNPLFCHQEFLEKMEANKANGVGKRAALLLHRLLVDERRQYFKGTHGANRGWRRSRLGGNGGSHFYAWWAPKGAPPFKDADGFDRAPEGALFIRDIRHHDDHTPLQPQSFDEQYLSVGVTDLRRGDYVPPPWTSAQTKFSSSRLPVRTLKGFPGSGKTTALWNAAESAVSESALYVTYSAELAGLAKDHFDRFAPRERQFQIVTFPRLLRELLGADLPVTPVRETRERFIKDLGLPPRVLGPWVDHRGALYDEVHAHLVGEALPVSVGRFAACAEQRLPDKRFRELRESSIGRPAAVALLESVSTIRRREGAVFEERYFPELRLAWRAAEALARPNGVPPAWLRFDCVAVDEVQDLTPVEALVVILLAAAIQKRRGGPPTLLLAGDEAQTVRPTDFEWAWLQDMLHDRLRDPVEFKLAANLRSPRRIAELVNRVWDLYGHLTKSERPSGSGLAEVDEDASDQVIYCAAAPGEELNHLLTVLSEREGLAIVSLDENVPAYVPAAIRHRILTVSEAKGLDFHSVCVLDAGKYVERVLWASERVRRDSEIEGLTRRLAIDQLRVALSRPAERLYWLDVSPSPRVAKGSLVFLNERSNEERISPVIPAVVLKTLEEETLDLDERVRLCEQDARQYLETKPDMAWTRAKQAAALILNDPRGAPALDRHLADSVHLTLAQVSFTLAFRKVKLSPELGRPDLWRDAQFHAAKSGKPGLAPLIVHLSDLERAEGPDEDFDCLLDLAHGLVEYRQAVEGWLAIELQASGAKWLERLEKLIEDAEAASELILNLPPLYAILGDPGAERKSRETWRKCLDVLFKAGEYQDALTALRKLPDPPPELLARCHEGLGEFAAAAELYRQAGNLKEALRNFRSVPDMEKALEIVSLVSDHPVRSRWNGCAG